MNEQEMKELAGYIAEANYNYEKQAKAHEDFKESLIDRIERDNAPLVAALEAVNERVKAEHEEQERLAAIEAARQSEIDEINARYDREAGIVTPEQIKLSIMSTFGIE